MKVYTAHLRRPGPDEDLIFVREGFSVLAFLLTWVWALVHRLWWFAGALLAAELALGAVGYALNLHPVGQASLTLVVSLLAGYLAGDVRRRALAARGYRDMGVVAAPDVDGATERFVAGHPMLREAMT